MRGRAITPLLLAVVVLPVGFAFAGGAVADEHGIEIEDAELSDEEIRAGETVTVTAEVENEGDEFDSQTVLLEIDGQVVAGRVVTLEGDEETTIEFTHSFEQPGSYEVWVLGDGSAESDGEKAGEVTVEEQAAPEFEVENAELSDSTVEAGETVVISAEVVNVGDAGGTFTAVLRVNGLAVHGRTVEVGAGEKTVVRFERTFEEPGEYALSVNGADVGVVTVTPAVTVSETDDGVTARVRYAGGASVVGIDFDRARQAEPAISVVALELATDRDAFEVTVFDPTQERADLPPLPAGEALGYVQVETDLGEAEVADATLTVRVREDALPGDVDPANVTIYRHVDGEWVELDATYDAEAGVYRADATGLSTLAVAVPRPGRVEVVDASVPADWVQRGHETTVEVTVHNPGDRVATRTVAVTVDGETVAREEVTLEPGERAVVSVEIPAVEGTVTVDGIEAGALTVGETTPPPADDDLSPEQTPGFGFRLVGLVLVVVALVGRALWR